MEYVVHHAEDAVLTHIITCRIEVAEPQSSNEENFCCLCQEKATWYCENDADYFCHTCDEIAHEGDDADQNDHKKKRLNDLRSKGDKKHRRVPASGFKASKFGDCERCLKAHPEKSKNG